MKLNRLSSFFLLNSLSSLVLAEIKAHVEPFPAISNDVTLEGYSYGDEIPIECIQRNMETGEHKFDEQG